MPELRMPVGGGTPPTPATGEVSLYTKPDKRFYMQDDTGAEVKILTNETTLTDISVTAPLTSSGGSSPTLAINNVTSTANGAMSSTDKVKLDGSTSTNTANALIERDPLGNFAANEITAAQFNGPATTVTTIPALTGDITTNGSTNVTSIGPGVIVNADISSSAAITMDKLVTNPLNRANHTGFQDANTLSNLGVEIDSHLNTNTPIVDAMVSASAAISITKLNVDPRDRATHTGSQSAATISDFDAEVDLAVADYLTNNLLTDANIDTAAAIDITKLNTDVLDRTEHTGSQLATTISDFDTAVDAALTAGDGVSITAGTIATLGTTNRIDVSNGTIDIASNYEGQSSINTLGTITTGTWNGNFISVFNGGTGALTPGGAANNLSAVDTITASTSIDELNRVVLVDASSAVVNIGLPSAAERYEFTIKKIDSASNNVIINVDPGDLIEGNTSYTLSTQYQYVKLASDEGTNWFIVGQS